MTTPICRAITLWQPWASLCVIPRCARYKENHRIAGGAVSCGFCNRTFTFNFMRDQGPHRCSCRAAVAARAEATRPFKTIETRSWKAPDSLIGQRIAIHAAARSVEDLGKVGPFTTWRWNGDSGMTDTTAPNSQEIVLPLGAIVGTAVLADCVSMVGLGDVINSGHPVRPPFVVDTAPMGGELCLATPENYPEGRSIEDQRPFGGFAPGRWAWLLDKPIKFAEPIPCRGYQRVWTVPEELRYIFARGALR